MDLSPSEEEENYIYMKTVIRDVKQTEFEEFLSGVCKDESWQYSCVSFTEKIANVFST